MADLLEAVRTVSVARTSGLVDRLDLSGLEASIRRQATAFTMVRYQAREQALNIALDVARAAAAEAVGVDLGWQFVDSSAFVSPQGRARNMTRLYGVAERAGRDIGRGVDPAVVLEGFRSQALALAGSEPHRLARIVSAEACASTPVVGRWQRFAEARACGWCQTLASRGAVYHREESAYAGGHTHCKCRVDTVADEVEAGRLADVAYTQYLTFAQTSAGQRRLRGPKSRAEFFADAPKFRPGQVTPERLASVRTQLDSYEAALARGEGTDWTRQRVIDLRTEMADLMAAL